MTFNAICRDLFSYPWNKKINLIIKTYKIFSFQELRKAFNAEVEKPKNRTLILSIAVPAGKEKVDLGYDVPKINR